MKPLLLTLLFAPLALASAQTAVLNSYAPPKDPTILASTFVDWDSLTAKPTPTGEVRQVFDNPTRTLDKLEVHVTTLNPGMESHPIHRHSWEEILLVTQGDFEVALRDEKDLFPGVAVDGVRLHAGIEGGDVDFELVEGAGGVVEDLADLAGGCGLGGEGVPVDEGAGEDSGVFGRGVGVDDGLSGGECERSEEQAEKRRFHAGEDSRGASRSSRGALRRGDQATQSRPFLSTRVRSLREAPEGFFSPRSHCEMSERETPRWRAKTA